MNVLARSSTKNRICTKKGILNIFSETDGKDAKKFLGDIFVSIIELNWGWINFIFAAGFFVSWVAFALIWYIIFWVHGDFLDHGELVKKAKQFKKATGVIAKVILFFRFTTLEIRWQYATK